MCARRAIELSTETATALEHASRNHGFYAENGQIVVRKLSSKQDFVVPSGQISTGAPCWELRVLSRSHHS